MAQALYQRGSLIGVGLCGNPAAYPQADGGAEYVNQAAATYPQRGDGSAAPAKLDAAADNIGGVRPRCDVEK